ncbi:methanogenesis marker 14 protein [Methanosalsum natronophilum]|nr:methanogenesis marker 14 protein [Methanosalsum natronophilum]MCS3923139.1 putative methanogenesis marker protein 14 [Methanosalsum natronophilum]
MAPKHVVKSPNVGLLEIKSKPYYIVASVEVGNTTTKCILTATNMESGKTHIVNRYIRMTREVRAPKVGEVVFGKTLTGVELTRQSISELVRDTLVGAVNSANLDIEKDIHFVVRSTGVVAGFAVPEDVGEFIKALADGCLLAGIPPSRMTPAMSVNNLPLKFQKYTKMEKVVFDGAVASVNPPIGSTGVEIVANEMEGELATAGIKEGAKWTGVDFRNPCISIDFGTTLDGRIVNSDYPYAKTVGNFCGYAGAIPDALIKGTSIVDSKLGTALDISGRNKHSWLMMKVKNKRIKELASKVLDIITIEKVPDDVVRYGSVPVNPKAAKEMGVVLIGCDVGDNGSRLNEVLELGSHIYKEEGIKTLFSVIDEVMANIVSRLVGVALEYNLLHENTSIGITGRAAITGDKPSLILKYLENINDLNNIENRVVFVDDALARGAAVMARCMNSMGTPFNPLGGNAGGKCIMGPRMKLQSH